MTKFNTILVLALLIQMASCKKNKIEPVALNVEVLKGANNSFALSWNNPFTNPVERIKYAIVLDGDTLITGFSSNKYALRNLKPNQVLGGFIVAKYPNQEDILGHFRIDTEKNDGIFDLPDPNFELALIKRGIDKDRTVNGYMDRRDAVKIEELILNDEDISSLVGIENFVGLLHLSSNNNNLDSVNLSSNISLTKLSLNDNKLVHLNLSRLKWLETIKVDHNKLKSLNLDDCIRLTSLSSNANLLENISLSNNNKLERLTINGNLFKSLNLRNNTQLISLLCNENILETLDLTQNKKLELLFCSDNKLELLNVQNNPVLTQFYCSKNMLTELELSKNISLNHLECSSNTISVLNLSNNHKLSSLISTNNPNLTVCVSDIDNIPNSGRFWNIGEGTILKECE